MPKLSNGNKGVIVSQEKILIDMAPVVIFLYDRPVHTNALLKSLKMNDSIQNTELFIYMDGPKLNASSEQLQKIQEALNEFTIK